VLILLWGNYYQTQSKDKAETINAAIQRNTNLAIALEQYAIRTIHNTDAILQLVKMDFLSKKGQTNIDRLLYDNAINKEFIRGVALINSEGVVTSINLPFDDPEKINVQDREFFEFHKTHDTDILYISKPVKSRTIHKPVIIFSRRINVKNKFAGVVAIQIEPSTFTSFYAQANLRPHDIISLIAPDGITYARRTGAIESNGEDISKSPLFQHVQSNPDSFYLAADAIRGIPTWFSYRKLKDYPIIATVGAAEKDILKEYISRRNYNRTSTIVISILIISFSIIMYLFVRNKSRYQQQLAKQMITAQEKERELIGNELHDNVNQLLMISKLYVEMALKEKDKEKANDLLRQSMDILTTSITEVRDLSHRLTAPALKTGSLTDSLRTLIETIAATSGLKINFDVKDYTTPLNKEQSLALYRIAQEQMNNILKHAHASAVDVKLLQRNGKVILNIKDDGVGFDSTQKRTGAGLNNIINRTKLFNGKVIFLTAPGKGCEIHVSMPVSKE
jgi:signal transduction histidine kinase